MSIIYLKDLLVEGKHGVNPGEKETPQRFKINLEVIVDNSKASISDKLDDTVNWSWLRDSVVNTVQDNSFNLLEKLAAEIAKKILIDKRVKKISLSIDKLEAFDNGMPGIKIEVGS